LSRTSKRRTGLIVGGAVALVAAAAAYAAYGLDFSAAPSTAAKSGLPPATGTVTRATLVETEKVSGTLGYGSPAAVAGRGTGTVTWLPAEGAVIERGQVVYRRDEVPVPLLYGPLPIYRVLASGAEGGDVKQLEENLVALGYQGFTVDDEYTSATADAVRAWQEDLGRTETGRVTPEDVVVAAGPLRVAELTATVGGSAAGPLLSYTDTTRVVSIALDVGKQQFVRPEIAAVVTLPDGSTVDGSVSTVGTVATSSGGGNGAPSSTTIDVTVTIADQSALGTLDAAPVTVSLEADRAEDVLTVPVAALVALAEGGYGVQVMEGSSVRYVAVTTGMFAGGRVEISGEGIAEGTVVGMPS
jgi:peptidoglycan hydrolase-like protein with peptidoglycan-binding domain